MSPHWFYKIDSEEFGPVPAKAIRRLYAREELTSVDFVRWADDSNWQELHAVAEDLGIEKIPEETVANHRKFRSAFSAANQQTISPAPSSPTQQSVVSQPPQVSASIVQAHAPPRSSPHPPVYFLWLSGQSLGPLSLAEIVQFIDQDAITGRDLIRTSETTPWQTVDSIPNLKSRLKPVAAKPIDTAGVRPANIPPAPIVPQTPVLGGAVSAQVGADIWFLRRDGRSAGPMAFATIIQMWQLGTLQEDSEVKYGNRGNWQTMTVIQQLFGLPPHPNPSKPAAAKPAQNPQKNLSGQSLKIELPGETGLVSKNIKGITDRIRQEFAESNDTEAGKTKFPKGTTDIAIPVQQSGGPVRKKTDPFQKAKTDEKTSAEMMAMSLLSEGETASKTPVRRPQVATTHEIETPQESATPVPTPAPAHSASGAGSKTPAAPVPNWAEIRKAELAKRFSLPSPKAKKSTDWGEGIFATISSIKDSFSGGGSTSDSPIERFKVPLLALALVFGMFYGYSVWSTSNSQCYYALKSIYQDFEKVKDLDSSHRDWAAYMARTKKVQTWLRGVLTARSTLGDNSRSLLRKINSELVVELTKDTRQRDAEAISQFKDMLAKAAKRMKLNDQLN